MVFFTSTTGVTGLTGHDGQRGGSPVCFCSLPWLRTRYTSFLEDIVAGGRVKMDFYEAGCGWGRVFIWVGFGWSEGSRENLGGGYVLAIWEIYEGMKNLLAGKKIHYYIDTAAGPCLVMSKWAVIIQSSMTRDQSCNWCRPPQMFCDGACWPLAPQSCGSCSEKSFIMLKRSQKMIAKATVGSENSKNIQVLEYSLVQTLWVLMEFHHGGSLKLKKFGIWVFFLQITLCPKLANELWKKGAPGCLGYIRGWHTTQVYMGLFHKPWNKDPVFKQPGFQWKVRDVCFFWPAQSLDPLKVNLFEKLTSHRSLAEYVLNVTGGREFISFISPFSKPADSGCVFFFRWVFLLPNS